MVQTTIHFSSVLFKAFKDLKASNPLRLAGATSFFATFAMPPLFIILLQLFGLVLNKEEMRIQMVLALSDIIGKESASQVQVIMKGMTGLAINPLAGIVGFLFLIFVATTLFKVIKDSIDDLWEIKISSGSGVKLQLFSRLKSLLVIALAGLLFIAGLFFDALQTIIGHSVNEFSGNAASILVLVFNKTFSLFIVTTWFTLLFRYLPDAVVKWKVAMMGGLVTGILFTIGKVVLRIALPYKDITSVFGAAGSFVLILLFVFYSSFILYYGACFIKEYSLFTNNEIKPRNYAFAFEVTDKNEKL